MIAARESPPPLWTIAELLRWTEGHFRRLGLPSPLLDAEVLLASALGTTRLGLYTEYQKLVEPEERARFRSLVERRSKREPVAYITGRREFYSLAFEVTRDVLVPRPETEHLVDQALAEIKALDGRTDNPAPMVLDLGTGSGNVAVAIAVNAPHATVHAIDSSARALEVAARNARAHQVLDRVSFHAGDFLGGVPPGVVYDLVISNPPYVSPREHESLMDDVRLHEPKEALIDSKSPGGDGLGFYRILSAGARTIVRPGGWIGVEVGAASAEGSAARAREVVEIFAASGLIHERTIRDLAGLERVVAVRAP